RLLRARGRCGLPRARRRRAPTVRRRARRNRAAALDAARGRARRGARRACPPRRACGRHVVVRGARRLPAPHAQRLTVRRDLGDGYELDDDAARIDLDRVHAYLANEAYWALGRPRDVQERLVREAARVVGLYHRGGQVGFCRAATDGVSFVYLADVYVLPEH